MADEPRDEASQHPARVRIGPPGRRPCKSCPYRVDVPAGIWAPEEYDKLTAYDAPTWGQPVALFQCHQSDRDSQAARICSGWIGCHDAENLLALRLGLLDGRIDAAIYQDCVAYVSPDPLFASGSDAAAHGRSGISEPSEEARQLIAKISRRRGDLRAP
ncbi:DUF6283 family protein [Streptomyces sp. NPDC055722]